MTRVKAFFSSFPAWFWSIAGVLISAWFMLSSSPMADAGIRLSANFDKVLHFLMAGTLTFLFSFDWQRKHLWKYMELKRILTAATVAFMFTLALELVQTAVPFESRYVDVFDIVAQFIGAYLAAFLFLKLQHLWTKKNG